MSVTSVEQLLTVDETMEHLRISRSKLHELVRDGELPAVKFGRRTLFRAAALQAFITAHEVRVEPVALKGKGR